MDRQIVSAPPQVAHIVAAQRRVEAAGERVRAKAGVLQGVVAMPQVRFNHMELSVPKGYLTPEMRADLTAFYGGALGWETRDVEILGGIQFLMRPDEGQFILVVESSKAMSAPGYDHLGLLCETRDEVDDVLATCRQWQEKDERVQLKFYDDLHTGNVVVHAFYVRYLLPIWFDVQVLEHKPGTAPARRWTYV